MCDITKPITFSEEEIALINEKLEDINFKHTHWSNEDLKELRKGIREYYKKIQSSICVYCRQKLSRRNTSNVHIEHIIPKSLMCHFIFEPKNLCVVCGDCNLIKGDREVLKKDEYILTSKHEYKKYPKKSETFKIYHPHYDIYEEHIFKAGEIYFPISEKGQYTVHVCQLWKIAKDKLALKSPLMKMDYVMRNVTVSYLDSDDENKIEKINQLKKRLL